MRNCPRLADGVTRCSVWRTPSPTPDLSWRTTWQLSVLNQSLWTVMRQPAELDSWTGRVSQFVVLCQNAADLMASVQHHRFRRQQAVHAVIQQGDAVDAAKHAA
jgi:hypothetical protein